MARTCRETALQKRLWTDEIVIYSRLKETLYHYYYNYYYTTGSGRGENLVCPRASTFFFLIRYCRGLTDCSRTDPSGSRSIFLVPEHEKGPPLATRYIVVPIHISVPDIPIHIYIHSLSTPLPLPYFSQFPRLYTWHISYLCVTCVDAVVRLAGEIPV